MTSIISIGNKLDNRLSNIEYLTRAEHTKIHMTGKKLSSETKEKIKFANKGRKLSEAHKAKLRKAKLRASSHKGKKVYCP